MQATVTQTTTQHHVVGESLLSFRQPGYKSEWKTNQAVPLTRESFHDLTYGKTSTIREPRIVVPEDCWKFEKELSPKVTPYKHNTGPLLTKVGVAQFEYQAQAQEVFQNRQDEQEQYFKEAAKWEGFHQDLATRMGINLRKRALDRISALFPEWDVEVAKEPDGRKY